MLPNLLTTLLMTFFFTISVQKERLNCLVNIFIFLYFCRRTHFSELLLLGIGGGGVTVFYVGNTFSTPQKCCFSKNEPQLYKQPLLSIMFIVNIT